MHRRILFLVTEDWYFCSHRMALACAAKKAGFEVTVATRVNDAAYAAEIQEAGFHLVALPWDRKKRSLKNELKTLLAIIALYRREKPTIVQHIGLKAAFYGDIAARLAHCKTVVNLYGGLGYAFTNPSLKIRLLRPLIQQLLVWMSNASRTWTVLQNRDDCDFFITLGVKPHKIKLIRGSGINVDRFQATEEPETPPCRVVFISRLLKDKGILELIEATEKIQRQNPSIVIDIVGGEDPGNPSSLSVAELQQKIAGKPIQYHGMQKAVETFLANSNIVVFPSHREGLPRVLLEAAASARAIATTDVRGCREVVVDEENGLLVPPHNSDAIANAILRLAEDKAMRARMGQNGRARVLRYFSDEIIVQETLEFYESLLKRTETP